MYMATSLNGYITKGDDDSNWVDDWEIFTAKIKEYGCIVMGRKTYECAEDLFPYENALNIVITSKDIRSPDENKSVFLNKSPAEIIKYAENRGFSQMLLIGGSKTNQQFINENLVNEIFITVHPLLIGDGKKLFEPIPNFDKKLELISVEQLKPSLVTLHYKILI